MSADICGIVRIQEAAGLLGGELASSRFLLE
jgi:hypothetical protein